jgi:hypothetical protein
MNQMTKKYIPSLPSPLASPYQVATEDDQDEWDEEYEVKLTNLLGLKQEEGITRNNVESKPIIRMNTIWEINACPSIGAILWQHCLDFVN